MKKILIIEDDQTIVEALSDTFRFHDFNVFTAGNGIEGYKMAVAQTPDIIILDIMLPDLDGFDICKKIRESNQEIPIIILTAKGQENDKLLGFELGADDYVTKPFSVKELVARVKAKLKRRPLKRQKNQESANGVVKLGDATIHFKNFTITHKGEEYTISSKEQQILKLLVENSNEVIDRNRIIDEVWGDEYFPSPRTIDNFILKLRNKIEPDPKNPIYILTVHGVGYKLKLL